MRVLCVYLRRAPCCASPASHAPEPALTCPPCLRPCVGVERVLGQVPHSEVRQRSGRAGDARPRAAGPSPPPPGTSVLLSALLPLRTRPRLDVVRSPARPSPCRAPCGQIWKEQVLPGPLRKMVTPAPLSPAHLGRVCLSTKPFGPPTCLQPICARLPPISRPRLPGRLRLCTKHAARTVLSPAHQPSTGTLET